MAQLSITQSAIVYLTRCIPKHNICVFSDRHRLLCKILMTQYKNKCGTIDFIHTLASFIECARLCKCKIPRILLESWNNTFILSKPAYLNIMLDSDTVSMLRLLEIRYNTRVFGICVSACQFCRTYQRKNICYDILVRKLMTLRNVLGRDEIFTIAMMLLQ